MSLEPGISVEEPLTGLLLLRSRVVQDHRGFFWETHSRRRFETIPGLDVEFVQANQSFSLVNVLRGIHYQLENPQGKLVRVSTGEIFDVTVDLRRSSPTFTQWFGVALRAGEGLQLWVPPGFGHGFLVTSPGGAYVDYSVSSYYDPPSERTLRWNDPTIAIEWPLGGATPILSDRDSHGMVLARAELFS